MFLGRMLFYNLSRGWFFANMMQLLFCTFHVFFLTHLNGTVTFASCKSLLILPHNFFYSLLPMNPLT